jgi:hypothetical protein
MHGENVVPLRALHGPPSAARARELAVLAAVDPRTILRAYRALRGQGQMPRGMPGERAVRVLRSEGLGP